MSSLPTIVVAPGVEIAPAADDPLILRRSDVSRELLREGIRQLTQLERDALRLATRERLGVPEIAARLQVSPEAIESSLRSGLLNLRRSLLDQLGTASP